MKKFIRFILISLITLLSLAHVYYFVHRDLSGCREYSFEHLRGNPLVATLTHQRHWSEYNTRPYCMQYNIEKPARLSSYTYLEQDIIEPEYTEPINYHALYGEIYDSLYHHDRKLLIEVMDSLLVLQQRHQLNTHDFAELIVSMVQDIPYSYVYGDDRDCDDRENKKSPCESHHRFGLVAPVDFLYTLVGDCDTRAVLLYTLLKDAGYDVLIATSMEYAHAVLAIQLPYTGDFIEHEGKKYYLWETTNIGWPPGVLPPSVNYVPYWHVALN